MQAFLRFPIILKLLLMAVPPLLLALYFMATSITDNHSRAVKMEAYLKLSQVSLHANALVHELQKERGASAIFLSSEGESFANELTQQRANSEKSLQALRQSLSNYKAYTPVLESILKDLDSSLAGIDKLRQEIDALQINVSTAVERYTQKNRNLLAITSFIVKDADDSQVSKSASAYVYLLKAKELAGLERALISRAFS
nr:nitrate- and nitrite sensing domain-containing protein [uncultured Pseudoteredinibacter sp.]